MKKRFPDISEDALESAVTSAYNDFQMKALGKKLHLTIETNLRNVFLLESVHLFKRAGYETRLIYMALPDISTSLDRLALRVRQKGHFVGMASIKANFEQGPQNLLMIANHFDSVMLVSGFNTQETETQPQLILTIRNGKTIHKEAAIPHWCIPRKLLPLTRRSREETKIETKSTPNS